MEIAGGGGVTRKGRKEIRDTDLPRKQEHSGKKDKRSTARKKLIESSRTF
jgi:hypothetical protein